MKKPNSKCYLGTQRSGWPKSTKKLASSDSSGESNHTAEFSVANPDVHGSGTFSRIRHFFPDPDAAKNKRADKKRFIILVL